MENKQKFISQIMTSKSPVRACEDVDDTALSYAEIKALATGNLYIKEKMDLDIQVSKLKLLKAEHTSQRYRLETGIERDYPVKIAALREQIAGLRADKEAIAPFLGREKEVFSMTVNGKTYTDRKEAGTALIAACSGSKAFKEAGQVGEFQGFTLSARFDMVIQRPRLTIKGKCSYQVEMGRDPLGNLQRISNALSGIGKRLEETERKLETVEGQLATAEEEVKKPFAREEELAEKLGRLSELDAMLNIDDNGPSGLDMDEDVQDKGAVDCLRQDALSTRGEPEPSRPEGGMGKPSVLGRLREAEERIAADHREIQGVGRKMEMEM